MGRNRTNQHIRDVHAQYAVLFGHIITINFAMIVAIYYFLHRAAGCSAPLRSLSMRSACSR